MPIKFMLAKGATAWGYRAEILPKICEVYLKARDAAGRKYDKKYLLMLKKLPGCKLAVGKELDPAHFIFDDGDGVIMPMRY